MKKSTLKQQPQKNRFMTFFTDKKKRVEKRFPFARRVQWLLIYCLVLAALFSLSPRLMDLSYATIDPSYNYGINKATADGLSFGDEFIATYGPLGHLVSNYLPENVLKVSIWMLAYVTALAVGVFLFCRMYIKGIKRQWLAATALLYVFAMTMGGGFIEWNYLSVFLLYCFVYLKAGQNRRLLLLIGLAVTAAVFSLVKFTLGLGSVLALLALCGFDNREVLKQRVRQMAIVGGVYVSSFILLGLLLHVSFVEYARTALILSGNFGSAMAQYDPGTAPATLFVALALLLLVLWPWLQERKQVLRYAFLLLPFFVLWKYSVSRQDSHIMAIVQVVIPVALLIYLSRKERTQRDVALLGVVVVLVVMAIFANKIPYQQEFARTITAPITNVRTHGFISFFKFGAQKERWQRISGLQLQKAALPQSMKEKIGSQGVDVFPWETVVVAANNLTWQNRPSPFSFQNFDPYLDDVNARFFESDKAPQFIVWHRVGASGVHGVDFRHILWDEPATFRAILSNYQFVESSDEFILLQKRAAPVALETVRVDSLSDQPPFVLPESNGLTFADFTVHRTLKEIVKSSLIRGETYVITTTDTEGKDVAFRFVQENSGQGFLINKLPKDWDELIMLLQSGNVPNNTSEFRIDAALDGPLELQARTPKQ